LSLRATDGERDSLHAIRAVLKFAHRRGLIAVDVREKSVRCCDARQRIAKHTSVGTGQHTMTSLRKYGPANKFIKLEELHDKPPMRERIGLVKPELGKFGERLVLTFEPSGRMLSLNKTSVGNLLRDFGEDDGDWIGKEVEVYAGEVKTENGPADAILVRAVDVPADAKAKAAKSTKAKLSKSSGSMDDEIPF
jgi:hypothetical protein